MKALSRGSAPAWLADTPESIAMRQSWYQDLRDPKGNIRDRWNKDDASKQQPIRQAIQIIGQGECAWCGCLLSKIWRIDHYLPKETFPHLSYCWTNLLPSCISCNEYRKKTFYPKSLNKDSLVDPALPTTDSVRTYIPKDILPCVTDRLIEPSYEEPNLHLKFVPAAYTYKFITDIGEETQKRFFSDKSDAEQWEKISNHVKRAIQDAISHEDLRSRLNDLVDLIGYSFYVQAYRDYWLELIPPPWL